LYTSKILFSITFLMYHIGQKFLYSYVIVKNLNILYIELEISKKWSRINWLLWYRINNIRLIISFSILLLCCKSNISILLLCYYIIVAHDSVPQKSSNASHKKTNFIGETKQKCLLQIVYFKNIIFYYFSYVSHRTNVSILLCHS